MTTLILSAVAIFIAINAIWITVFTHHMSKKNHMWMLIETQRYGQWRIAQKVLSRERKWLLELEGIKRILKQDRLWDKVRKQEFYLKIVERQKQEDNRLAGILKQ